MCKGSLLRDLLGLRYLIAFTLGEELEAFIVRNQPAFDRVIYIGDGSNDFCPILRMRRYVPIPE